MLLAYGHRAVAPPRAASERRPARWRTPTLVLAWLSVLSYAACAWLCYAALHADTYARDVAWRDLAFYLMLKAQGRAVRSHPVIDTLLRHRILLERLRPLESKLSYRLTKLLQLAASGEEGSQGLSTSQQDLAERYAAGRGVPRVRAEAIAWFRKAAQGLNLRACLRLGVLLELQGSIDKDPDAKAEAQVWYAAAAEGGEVAAIRWLADQVPKFFPHGERDFRNGICI